MSLYVYALRLLRLWRFWILALVALAVLATVFGQDLLSPLARTCPAPPTLSPDLTPQAAGRLRLLYDLGLLYCADSQDTFEALSGPVYWGSDGLVSILYFPLSQPGQVAVRRYVFGNGFPPSPLGDGPLPGLDVVASVEVTAEPTPASASYFYRLDGAPADDDYSVTIELIGPARRNTGLQGRSFWRDLDRLLAMARQRTIRPASVDAQLRLSLPILPDRWRQVRARQVMAPFANEQGRFQVSLLEATNPTTPVLVQTLNGPLASTVWIAGVERLDSPAFVLTTQDGTDIQPWRYTWWNHRLARAVVTVSFPSQPGETVGELRFWRQAADRERRAPPSQRWSIRFPMWKTSLRNQGGSQ